MVHRSEPGEVLRTESLRHTSVLQGLNRLGLQHAYFQTRRRRLLTVQLRAEPFETYPYKADPTFDCQPEASVFVDNAAKAYQLGSLSIPLPSCFDHERWCSGFPVPCSQHHCPRLPFRHSEACCFEYSRDGSHHFSKSPFADFEKIPASSAYIMRHTALRARAISTSFPTTTSSLRWTKSLSRWTKSLKMSSSLLTRTKFIERRLS